MMTAPDQPLQLQLPLLPSPPPDPQPIIRGPLEPERAWKSLTPVQQEMVRQALVHSMQEVVRASGRPG